MDNPCYKCGHTMEEGKAFCPHCGAPQIRVSMPEPAVESTSSLEPSQIKTDSHAKIEYPGFAAGSYRFGLAQPSALAAIAATALMFLGLNPFVAALGAGFLAVVFSRRRQEGETRMGAGAKLGALSGIFLFAVSSLLETLIIVVFHKGAEIRGEMLEKVQEAATRYPGPEVQPFLDYVKSPGGFTFMLVASLVFGCLAFVLLGSVGGALGATLLGRRNRP
jgi:hypothetical protein